jgi:hypothetical protein
MVTVTPADDISVGEYDEPTPGRRYIAIDVEVENIGDEVATVSPSSSLTVIDSEGRQAEPGYVSGGDCTTDGLDEVRLSPGDSRRGCVVFEIAQTREVARVQFALDGSDGTDEALGEWSGR